MKDDLVTLTVPRSALHIVAAPPAFVSQQTVEAVVGISRRRYVAWAKEGRYPVTRDGRRLLAKTEDVIHAVEADTAGIVRRDTKPENDTAPPTALERLTAAGARRIR